MEIEQSFTVPYPLDAVWARFHNTPEIVACLPGASLTAPVENGMLKLAMTVKLGPIVASFAGDGEMTLDDAQYRGSITGAGVDRKSSSRVKGVASFALEAVAASETRVDVKVDYTIGGSLAQFSRGGIVKELATRMTEAFAKNLKAKLDETVEEPDIASDAVPGIASDTASGVASSIASDTASDTTSGIARETASDISRMHAGATLEPIARETDAKADAKASVAPLGPGPQTRVESRPAARAQPANAPLDVGNLFWKMLWSRLRGLFSFGAR